MYQDYKILPNKKDFCNTEVFFIFSKDLEH